MSRTTSDQAVEDEDWMRGLIAEAGDPHVEARLEHVASLRSLVLGRLAPARPGRRWRAALALASGLAAVVIAVAMLAPGRSAVAWAQVARALQQRPWTHARLLGPDGKEVFEHWLNSDRTLAGERGGPTITFHDHKLKVFTKYVAAEDVVYHLPEPPPGTPSAANFSRQLLDLLLDPAGPPRFPFPGMERIGQTRTDIEEAGKKWVEIELTLRIAGGSRGGPLSMRIRVDPATNLPTSLAMQAEDGKRYTAEVDYPDRGPSDIYDLGAPRTAKVIDRSPLGEVDRILARLKAGRDQFDDYRGFVVAKRVKVLPGHDLPRVTVYRVWHKGRRWRVEQLRPGPKGWEPPDDADARWWIAHQGDLAFIPRAICDGQVYWDYYLGDDWKPGLPVPPVGSGHTAGPNPLQGASDDPILPFWCQDLLPEQAGHPSAGIYHPDHDREFLVEPNPGDGPPETSLLRGRDPNARAGTPDHFRLWLDPRADFLAMRTELRVSEAKDPAKVAFIDIHTLEAVARSPKGHAYPTRARQVSHNGANEVVRTFFLDFESAVPDEVFQPLK